jgi:hypothetical protein
MLIAAENKIDKTPADTLVTVGPVVKPLLSPVMNV